MGKYKPRKLDTGSPIRKLRSALSFALLALVVLRLCILVLSDNQSAFYLVRQSIYTLTWLSIAFFMLNCSMYMHRRCFEKHELKNMKRLAFWAMVGCIARIIVATLYYWPIVTYQVWTSVHNVLELVVWCLLAVFFGKYWSIRADQERQSKM